MIFSLNVCAVRAIIVTASLLVGLSSPPGVFDQADQNISSAAFSSGTDFVSLELSELVTLHDSYSTGKSTLLFQQQPMDHSLLNNHGTFTLASELYYLTCLQQSLTHWVEWITSNLLSIGLVCASVLYLSLLSTILYYIWKHTNKNKSLTKSIRIVNATLACMESTRFVRSLENDRLEETRELLEQQLLQWTAQSEASQQLVWQAQQNLVVEKEELKKERMNVDAEKKQLYSEHAEILSKINGKLENTQTEVSLLQKLESDALIKSTSLKKLLVKERKEWTKKQLLLSNVVTELQQELHETKEAQRRYAIIDLEGQNTEILRERSEELYFDVATRVVSEQSLISVQLIEKKLRHATDEIVQLNTRFSYAMINEYGYL